MAIDIIARGLATSLIGNDGKIASDKMPTMNGTSELTGFFPIGKLTDASLIEGRTAEEILLMMLYGVVNPTFTAPQLSIGISEESDPLIIGRDCVLKGALIFERGTIEPAYGTSGNRAGLPTSYVIGDSSIVTNSSSYDFEITVHPTDRNVLLNYGVNYAEGEQPMNSIGKAVDAPYPAGSIFNLLALDAAYALYKAEGTEQEFTWFEDTAEDGQGYLASFPNETAEKKQSFMVSTEMTVVGIKGYNSLTKQWEWLGGETAAASLTHFDTKLVLGESLGEETDYILYTHNQARVGQRELRIYVQ